MSRQLGGGRTRGLLLQPVPQESREQSCLGLSGHRTPFKLTLNIHAVAAAIIATNPPLICGSLREKEKERDANAAEASEVAATGIRCNI